MANSKTRFGNLFVKYSSNLVNIFNTIMKKEYMAFPAQFPLDRFTQKVFIEFNNMRFDGNAFLRRRLDNGHILSAGQRHMQGARNRGGC